MPMPWNQIKLYIDEFQIVDKDSPNGRTGLGGYINGYYAKFNNDNITKNNAYIYVKRENDSKFWFKAPCDVSSNDYIFKMDGTHGNPLPSNEYMKILFIASRTQLHETSGDGSVIIDMSTYTTLSITIQAYSISIYDYIDDQYYPYRFDYNDSIQNINYVKTLLANARSGLNSGDCVFKGFTTNKNNYSSNLETITSVQNKNLYDYLDQAIYGVGEQTVRTVSSRKYWYNASETYHTYETGTEQTKRLYGEGLSINYGASTSYTTPISDNDVLQAEGRDSSWILQGWTNSSTSNSKIEGYAATVNGLKNFWQNYSTAYGVYKKQVNLTYDKQDGSSQETVNRSFYAYGKNTLAVSPTGASTNPGDPPVQRVGHVFTGWSNVANPTSTNTIEGWQYWWTRYSISTIYAIWDIDPNFTPFYYGVNGEWKPCTVYYGVNGEWKLCNIFYGTGGEWKN